MKGEAHSVVGKKTRTTTNKGDEERKNDRKEGRKKERKKGKKEGRKE